MGTLRFGGIGWSFDFGPTVVFSAGFATDQSVTIVQPDQTMFQFKRNNTTGIFAPIAIPIGGSEALSNSRFSVEFMGSAPTNWGIVNTQPTSWKITDQQDGKIYFVTTQLWPTQTSYVRGYATQISSRSGYTWNLVYGSEAELSSVTDSFGRQLSFTYINGAGVTSGTAAGHKILIETITLPDGRVLRYDYDPTYPDWLDGARNYLEHLVKVETLSGPPAGSPAVISERAYHYEDTRFPFHLTGITDERGERYATWSYDGRGRVTSSQHGVGADLVEFAYASPSATVSTTTVTNALGKQAVYTFNRWSGYLLLASIAGQPSANCPASNSTFTYTQRLMATFTDEEGRVTKYTRNAQGLPTTIVEAFGTVDARTTSLVWRSDRQLDLRTIANLTTDYIYDTNGRLTGVTQTDTTTHSIPYSTATQARSWTYAYTTEGLVSSVDGPLPGSGDTTYYTYGANGYLSTVTDPLGHVSTVTSVDGNGRPLAVTDANGVVRTLTYSDAGFLSSVTVDPSGANVLTELTYDKAGLLTLIEREDGSRLTMEYDDARRLVSTTDATGAVVEYTYDGMGGITQTQIKNPAASVVYNHRNTFDELGRLLTSIGANAETWTFGYDKVSNPVSAEDPRGGVMTASFNRLNELIATVDQATFAETVGRDGQGNIVSYADGRSVVTSYVRNGWGEVIQESSLDIGTVVYERNALGLITKKIDARGIVANYEYDVAGRLIGIAYPAAAAENVTFTYDDVTGANLGKGKLTGVTDQAGTLALTYNSLGLLSSESRTLFGTTATTSYVYDNAGELFYIIYPSGRTVSYWKNSEGKIASVASRKTSGAPLVDLAYDIEYQSFGQVRYMMFGNGTNLWRTFDQNYRDEQLGLYDGASPLMARYHGYTDGLNLTNIWDNVNSSNDQSLWYAANNRLQEASGPWGEDTYYFDGSGNRTWHINVSGGVTTTDQYSFGASNRLDDAERNGAPYRSFTSDAAGNVLTDTIGTTTTTYTYNNADRLSVATKAGAIVGQYTYNAFGQLVIRNVTNTLSNGVTVYFYDQEGHVIAEYDGTTGAPKREYVWLGDRPIAIIDPATGGADAVYYIHADHLNRPLAMTDASKAIVANYSWLPFGGLHAYAGSKGFDLRFPGQLLQAETGLHYNWNRHYDPTTGRYTQPDPLGLIDAPSRYGYVGGDPIQKVDPTGLIANFTPVPEESPSGLPNSNGTGEDMKTCMAGGLSPFPSLITKNNCIAYCSDVALPTHDHGFAFHRCVNQCMAGLPFKDGIR